MSVQPPLTRPSFLGAFGILERGDRLLVVSNRRLIDGEEREVWDIPGGGVEETETLCEALVREMREETGLRVEVGPLLFVSEGERVVGGRRVGVWRSFFFHVTELAGELDTNGDDEVLEARWVTEHEALELFTAPYHGGFRRFLRSGRELRHAFDRWED